MTRIFSISFEECRFQRERSWWPSSLVAAVAGCVPAREAFSASSTSTKRICTSSLDGSATLIVNASIPALVALRGIDLDLNPATRPDLDRIRAAYQSPVDRGDAGEPAVAPRRPALRAGAAERARTSSKLSEAPPFSWSRYRAHRQRTGITCSSRRSARRRCGRARCRTSAGTGRSSSRSGCTCRAGSSGTTRAISRPIKPTETARGNILGVGAAPRRSSRGRAARHHGRDGQPVDPASHAVAVCRRLRRRGRGARAPHLVHDAEGWRRSGRLDLRPPDVSRLATQDCARATRSSLPRRSSTHSSPTVRRARSPATARACARRCCSPRRPASRGRPRR